jgi:hypothetical protein
LRPGSDTYRYEREVEEFLRRSPTVTGATDGQQSSSYGELSADELVPLISSLDPDAAARLRSHEAAGRGRKAVLDALDRRLRALQR